MLVKRIITAFAILSILFTVGCEKSESLSDKVTDKQPVTEIISEETTASTTEATEPVTEKIIETQPESESETTDLNASDYDVVKEIRQKQGATDFEPYNIFNGKEHISYKDEADFLTSSAEKLENRFLGEIVDENDLIAKAREVFAFCLGDSYIAYVERETAKYEGVEMKLERSNPPYRTEFYEDSGVWFITTLPPSGKLENGKGVDVIWDNPPFLLIRGSDGKIIGCQL